MYLSPLCGLCDNSPAIHRWEWQVSRSSPGGTKEITNICRPSGTRHGLRVSPAGKLPDYFQTVPVGTTFARDLFFLLLFYS